MSNRLAVILIVLVFPLSAVAQKSITDFSLKNVTNDQTISLSSMKDKKAVVVVFTSNYCPYAKLYEDRLIGLYSAYEDQNVGFVLVNPNHPETSPEDAEAMMIKRAKEKSYPFAYLSDKDQAVAKLFDARKTPEAFVLRPTTTGFQVLYQGAIDDNPQSSGEVRNYHLKDALNLAIAGKKPAESYQRPTGCMIRGN
ncbi:MAG: thioredoxin family protein [Cyclobacteriaceae bacterium]